ncbi:YhcN/YlaJ family sporulation lipoprotein [Bacillus massiliglaciei]|uniref:YhcN/YlaJ family sporulation lipoprotein n=1 Tax=Bacillus massiliglaciei TaxID=1816693 RepID=UPI000AE61212|nr:YhcN/YlaJ family sporulation lipoprotein [Bacillus massiliglaciei]
MQKIIVTVGISSILALTACSENKGSAGLKESESINPANMGNPIRYYDEDYQNTNRSAEDFGFVRMNSAAIEGQDPGKSTPMLNREELAKVISSLCIQIPNVEDVSALVTDEEVLIVYQTDSNNRNETADQVKRTAMSAVPRFYHVYVSDNKALAQNVENFATLGSNNRDIEYMIEKTVEQMLKSPQGFTMSESENENGELTEEKNNHENIHENTKNF